MQAPPRCPECGSPLPVEAPMGLCPGCLLTTAIEVGPTIAAAPVGPGSAAPARLAPHGFGDYEVIECIASGGMGVVYKARHRHLGRLAAVKTLPFGRFTRDSQVRRFQAEARAASRLRHPHIVAIHEVGEYEGQPWFAMDFIEGQTLAEILRGDLVPVARAVRWVRSLAEAVHYAHGEGILHRDLKPSNILVDPLDQPHITDFGLAKDLRSESELTLSSQALGSPNYMPPEQCGRARQVSTQTIPWTSPVLSGVEHAAGDSKSSKRRSDDDRRQSVGPPSDVYGLGAILYHLLTGRPPFLGASVADVLLQVCESDPLPLRLLVPKLPRDLDTICLRCLEKDPNHRYRTAGEIAEELARWQSSEPIRARPVSRTERAWRWCRRKPALASFALLSLILLFVVIVGSPIAVYRIDRARLATQRLVERQQVQLAEDHFRRDETSQGIAHLTQVLRGNPNHRLAADRLMSVLTYRHFPLPVTPPLHHDGAVIEAVFSPDRRVVATATANGTAHLWDARSGMPIGSPMIHPLFVQAPYSNRVWSIAFSPDGRRVATASANGAARLWAADTGAPLTDWLRHGAGPEGRALPPEGVEFSPGYAAHRSVERELPGHQGAKTITERRGATSVCFSPDGSHLVTTGDDGVARIWDASSGRPLLLLTHEGLVWSSRFSRDGQFLVTTSWDTHAYVWEVATGRLLARLPHEARVWTADFSPDGEWLVTGERWERARVWRREGDEWKWTRDMEFNGEVFFARFTPDGERIVVAESNRGPQVRIYETRTGNELHRHTELAAVIGGDLTADGRWFVVATAGEDAHIYDAKTGVRVAQPVRCTASVLTTHFSLDGSFLLTGDAGGVAQVWELENQPRSEAYRHPKGTSPIRAEFSADGLHLVTVGYGSYGALWDLTTGRALNRLPQTGNLFSLRQSSDGRRFATGSDDHTAMIWRSDDGQAAGPPLSHPKEVKDLDFSPDGLFLVTACADGQVRLWNTQTFELVRSFQHRSDVRTVQFSRDGRHILTASDDFTAQVWETSTGERSTPPMQHRNEVWWAEYSPANDLVATASTDGTARVWDVHTGQPTTAPLKHRSAVTVVHFGPAGDLVATASEDRTVVIWNARTGQPVTEPILHDSGVNGIAFDPSGRWVVSSSSQQSVRFWDVASGLALSEPFVHGDRMVSPSPDGRRVAVTSRNGRVRIIEAPGVPVPVPEWVLDLAEAVAGQRRTSDGVQRIEPGELSRLRWLNRSRDDTDAYDRWVSWFFADPKHRTLNPGSRRTTDEYLAILLEDGTHESLREAAELSPNDPVLLARLAEEEIGQSPTLTTEARFHLDRAFDLAPDHPRVLEARQRVLETSTTP